jgi:hypothetical protein
MNITDCVVTVLKNIIDSQCQLKTTLYPVLISEIPGIVFIQ